MACPALAFQIEVPKSLGQVMPLTGTLPAVITVTATCEEAAAGGTDEGVGIAFTLPPGVGVTGPAHVPLPVTDCSPDLLKQSTLVHAQATYNFTVDDGP